MTGRARTTRGAPRAADASSATLSEESPAKRATRQTSAAVDEAAMPPPPAPVTRGARVTRGQSKEADPARLAPSRLAALSLASAQLGIQEEGTESEAAEDAVVAEQLLDSQSVVAESESLGVLPHLPDGASDYRDSQSQDRYSRGFLASTPARSDVYDNTPGGRRARAKVLLRFLPHLETYANDVQEELYNYNDQDETFHLTYDEVYEGFEHLRFKYQPDGFLINDARVIERLDVDPDSATAFKASRTVSLANITSLLVSIHDAEVKGWDAGDLLPSLQAWDEAFPTKFLPRREAGERPLVEASMVFHLALQLRIQRTIYTFEEVVEGEPLSLIDAIWIDPKGLSPRDELLAFLTGSDDGGAIELKKTLAGVSLTDESYTELRNQYIAQVRRLYAAAASADLPSAVAELKKENPIEPLAKELQKWARVLFHSIHLLLDPARASTQYRDSQSVMASQVGDSQADSQVDPRMFAPEARPAAYAGAELADLQQLREFEAQAVPSQSSPSVLGRDKVQAEFYTSSVYPPPTQQSYIQATPGPSQPRPQHSGVQFAQSAAAQATRSPYQPPASTATTNAYGKRPADTQDSDDPFETDDRSQAKTPPRPRKRARARRGATGTPSAAGTPGGAEADQQVAVRRPPAPGAGEPDLDSISQRARAVTIEHRKPKMPQTRTPWSRNDERTLIKAVEVHEAKWSTIERNVKSGAIRFEREVNQQALRDKARLLKVDFLKADRILPPGFDLVVLGKKERDIVIACGKNPYRSEQDYDDDGKPTNLQYIPPDEE